MKLRGFPLLSSHFHSPELWNDRSHCLSHHPAMFRATSRLLDCRITFFTRSPCGLCDTAKAVVQNVNKTRPLQYQEINVMEAGQEKWKNVYEFDTPVVSYLSSTLNAEYLSGLLDPYRQSQCTRDDNCIVEAHASLQQRASNGADGRGRTVVTLRIGRLKSLA